MACTYPDDFVNFLKNHVQGIFFTDDINPLFFQQLLSHPQIVNILEWLYPWYKTCENQVFFYCAIEKYNHSRIHMDIEFTSSHLLGFIWDLNELLNKTHDNICKNKILSFVVGNRYVHNFIGWILNNRSLLQHINQYGDIMLSLLPHACIIGNIDLVREIISLQHTRSLDLLGKKNNAFILACSNGHLPIVELLLSLQGEDKINVHVENEEAFRWACNNGHLSIVELLLSLQGEDKINVHADNEDAFRGACNNGHLELVKLLLSLQGEDKINVHAENESAFRWACFNGHKEIVQLLWSYNK
jgi:hypothetical protein